DGMHSTIRKRFFPATDMETVREMEIVCTVCCPQLSAQIGGTFTKWESPEGGLAFGALPLGDNKVIWFMQFDTARYGRPERDPDAMRDFVRRIMRKRLELANMILMGADFRDAYLWKVQRMTPPDCFFRDRIALIGDAAHPLMPLTSQGVNSAMNDAFALSEILWRARLTGQTVPEAFAQYDARRRPTITRFVHEGDDLLRNFLAPKAPGGKFVLPFLGHENPRQYAS
ncbi:MAG: NAD(P)/FAD-dependent oxidoreductase, partial [Bacteroidota bacterium]